MVKSGLVCWDGPALAFHPRYQGDNDCAFEKWWKQAIHPKFGRYMAWVLFVVGSENLIKAACVCNGIGPKPPELDDLGKYTYKHLTTLCKCRKIDGKPKGDLTGAYKFLNKIRNRDAHGYRADKRRPTFQSVEKEFVPAFNTLVGTMENHFPKPPAP